MSESSTTEKDVQRCIARVSLEQFYAEHFTLLDEGDAEGWVNTFTEEGIFVPPDGRPDVKGRATLRAGTEKTIARLSDADTVRRHVLTNLNVLSLAGRKAETRAYVLVVDSAPGETRITTSTVMRDELTSDGTHWYVAHRIVQRDDLRDS